MSELLPLILTLKLDQKTFSYFDQLRQQHFPPEKNFYLPTSLFSMHYRVSEVKYSQTARILFPFGIISHFQNYDFLAKEFAVEVECPELINSTNNLQTTGMVG